MNAGVAGQMPRKPLIAILANELAIRFRDTVLDEAQAVAPPFFSTSDIRRIMAATVDEGISSTSFPQRLEMLAAIPGVADKSPEMRMVRFSLGDHVAEVLREHLEEDLRPLSYELAFEHYEGRVLQIMCGAADLADELTDGPASRFVRQANVESYRRDLDVVLSGDVVPPDDFLDSMLNRSCDFFSPLDKCLEKPEWGIPEGISEETVGRSATEIRSWFSMVADLQRLCMRRPMEFSTALAEELSALPPPPSR
ncbi:hypothetical protein G6L37_01000 [Agrobacterium rubi]|nr:hypothetical protein [Agrobacterium rubi]NTF23969.1 hypothetical protein [Agrobacterium rubi]